jgi:hypothetical protein
MIGQEQIASPCREEILLTWNLFPVPKVVGTADRESIVGGFRPTIGVPCLREREPIHGRQRRRGNDGGGEYFYVVGPSTTTFPIVTTLLAMCRFRLGLRPFRRSPNVERDADGPTAMHHLLA